MALQKHIGVSHLGSRLAIIFMKIPEEEGQALVVETESLPPRYLDSFADLLTRNAQQTNEDLPSLLHRNRFPSGEPMLQALHDHGFLRKMNVEDITMFVDTSGTRMPLIDILNAMDGKTTEKAAEETPEEKAEKSIMDIVASVPDAAEVAATKVVETNIPVVEPHAPANDAALKSLLEINEKFSEQLSILTREVAELKKPKKRGRPPKAK